MLLTMIRYFGYHAIGIDNNIYVCIFTGIAIQKKTGNNNNLTSITILKAIFFLCKFITVSVFLEHF